jgi:hypothetical protein
MEYWNVPVWWVFCASADSESCEGSMKESVTVSAMPKTGRSVALNLLLLPAGLFGIPTTAWLIVHGVLRGEDHIASSL